MNFENIRTLTERAYAFTLSPIHVTYANTIRRLILTGVETVAFRSDMTSTGSTTDVVVKRNDTPMTNEMLADRIGLIPINIVDPLTWNSDKFVFTLNVAGEKDNTTYVRSSDFKVKEIVSMGDAAVAAVAASEAATAADAVSIPTEKFFPSNTITGDTCLIATLQPGSGVVQQFIEIEAKATKGTGREHARFIPVSQCSYEYTPDSNPQRIEEMFVKWLDVAKKASAIEKGSERYNELRREFNTMQIKRCYKVNEKNEPFSFDFTIETAGVLSVPYIVKRACEVGENMCSRYVNIHRGDLPNEITISSADTRIIGFDFLIRGHDHTLGNLLQTWLVENHIQGGAKPKITYAGYSVPHPLRDEIILRIGVEDGEEATARLAVAEAAKGCVDMFQKLRIAWQGATGAPVAANMVRRRGPRVATSTATSTAASTAAKIS